MMDAKQRRRQHRGAHSLCQLVIEGSGTKTQRCRQPSHGGYAMAAMAWHIVLTVMTLSSYTVSHTCTRLCVRRTMLCFFGGL